MRRFVCFCSIFLATSSFAEEWAWALTPYGWVIDVDMDTGLDEPSGGTTEFSDILDILDFAALVHFEGHKDRFGFLVDIQYFELSDRTTHGSIEVDTDTSAALIEGAVIVALSDGAERTELLFGVRSIVGKLEVEFETTGPGGFIRREKEDKALVDAMVGIRHTRPLSDKWAFNVRGDIAAGDTDFSWNVELGVARQVGDSGTLHLKYRHLNIEADLGSLEPELTLFGPMIGYTFHF